MDFDLANEAHANSLARHITAWLKWQGPQATGLEVVSVTRFYRHFNAYYIYENAKGKEVRDRVEFEAYCHATGLEDVRIEGEFVPREFYEGEQE